MKKKVTYDPRYAIKAFNDKTIETGNEFITDMSTDYCLKFGYLKGYSDAYEELQGAEREEIIYH